MRGGKLVDKRFAAPLQPEPAGAGPMVMRDISERVSPVDGTVITSRTQLAAHNRRNGVIDCGNEHAVPPEKWGQPKPMREPVGPHLKAALEQHGY